jgi:hypothetical protein
MKSEPPLRRYGQINPCGALYTLYRWETKYFNGRNLCPLCATSRYIPRIVFFYALSRSRDVILDGVRIGEFNLLTTCTHHSELQVITALLLISTAPARPFPASCVFNSRSLATASNSGDYSASRAHVVNVRRISRNSTLVNWQLNYSAISSQPPLQNSSQLPTFY